MREDIRKVLFTAVDAGGWLVAQPHPTAFVEAELDDVDLTPEEPADGTLTPPFAMFAPDVQPLAMWLVDSGRLPKNRLSDVLEDTKDPGEYILRIVYDALPEGAARRGGSCR